MNAHEYERLQWAVEIAGRYVSYVDAGRGEPIVLLHGIPTWGYLWHEVIPPLARDHRVIVPDLLGYGHSDKRDAFDRSIDRQAATIDALLARLGIDSAAVVGHDIGGGVALRLAAQFPGRVSRLGIVDGVCYDSWPIEAMLQLGHPRMLRLPDAVFARMLRLVLRRALPRDTTAEVLDALVSPYATEVGKVSLVRDAAALNTNHTMEITPMLSRIGAPALVVWGEDDPYQRVEYGIRLASDLPGARLVRWRDVGHFVPLERPEALATEIRALLDTALPRAAGVTEAEQPEAAQPAAAPPA